MISLVTARDPIERTSSHKPVIPRTLTTGRSRDILHHRISAVDCKMTAQCVSIVYRVDELLLECMQYCVDRHDPSRGEIHQLGKELGQQPMNNALDHPPLYKYGTRVFGVNKTDTAFKSFASDSPIFLAVPQASNICS
ncbi:hypothetical protein BS47DRAFT_874319 [Hydnum rufescens UP504]|uniref:Fatty acid synthase type I helical domain-containing protein n=1 Tax=Hydnum rufescens UP504 TaxID=1448309 RepID=A0A9P6AZ50_9AGAM|nr:hypothetical protein BS47DRAFT_874319 [Hydnum rufescens UP504]